MVAANAEVLRLRYKPILADIGRIRRRRARIHGLLCASALKMGASTKRQALAAASAL
jgi:hypothetical protein